jgi:hypothetical protein
MGFALLLSFLHNVFCHFGTAGLVRAAVLWPSDTVMQTPRLLLTSALGIALLAPIAIAQSQPVAQPVAASAPIVLPAPAANISAMLGRLDQISQSMQVNLAKLRIDRWKADSSTKAQAQGNVTSLQRNLSSALPNVVGEVRNDPANLTSGLKLYRNVNALYEVLSSVTEYAGAFGSKEDYRSLGTDAANLDDARRLLADQLEGLASVKESQIMQLRNQVTAAQAAAPTTPPKKIIVDDNSPAKKAPKKKKSAPAATASGSPAPASSTPQ